MVASFDPSFVVTAGDNVYPKQNYQDQVRDYYAQKLVPATGNHDYENGIAKFDEFFAIDSNSRTYVYKARSGVDFFLLDSTAGLASKATRLQQQTWLARELAQSEANFKVVVLHHPPYSSGKHGSTRRYQWNYAELGADLVLSGHDHTYERIARRGGMYAIAGTGGAKLYDCGKPVYGSLICDDKHYGALFLYVNSFQLRGVFRTSSGETLDTFTISK
jgi:predicted phosphodiesterase